jgi:hypothetical protein
MKENLISAIKEIQTNTMIFTFDEASIKSGVIQRMLSLLGWNPFDIKEVKPEFTVGSKRVDFSLRFDDRNKVFIEVKRPNENLENHQQQLLDYAFQEGVKLAILTNGFIWWFYLPLSEGSWEQRRFFTIDFYEQEPSSIAQRLLDLLEKTKVVSGEALRNAEDLYTSDIRGQVLKKALPKAWEKIIGDPDDILVELLIETTARISGFRPEIDEVTVFLGNLTERVSVAQSEPVRSQPPTFRSTRRSILKGDYINKRIDSFTFLGKSYRPRSWKELLLTVCEELYQRHANEFSKCLNLHGTKMTYISLKAVDLRQPAQIDKSPYFVETHLNSNSIVQRAREITETFGYTESDLIIIAI